MRCSHVLRSENFLHGARLQNKAGALTTHSVQRNKAGPTGVPALQPTCSCVTCTRSEAASATAAAEAEPCSIAGGSSAAASAARSHL